MTLHMLRPRLIGGEVSYRPELGKLTLTEGHSFRYWTERNKLGEPVPGVPPRLVVILGEQIGRLLSRGFHTLNVNDPNGLLDLDMLNKTVSEGAYRIPKGSKKPELVFAEDDPYHYVIMGFGLVPMEVVIADPKRPRGKRSTLWTEPDLLEFARRGINFESHGFHGMGGANAVIASEAGIEPVSAEAKTLWSTFSRDKVHGTVIKQYGFHLIAIDKNGGEGMFRDADGTVGRLVGTPEGLRIVDASGKQYGTFFNLAEDARLKGEATRREATRAAKKAKTAEADAAEEQPAAVEVEPEPTLEQPAVEAAVS